MTYEYFPLHIWIQKIDDFGVEIGEPKQTLNLELLHAQVGDYLVNPRYQSEYDDAFIKGEFIIQEREFQENRGAPYPSHRNLTIYVRDRV